MFLKVKEEIPASEWSPSRRLTPPRSCLTDSTVGMAAVAPTAGPMGSRPTLHSSTTLPPVARQAASAPRMLSKTFRPSLHTLRKPHDAATQMAATTAPIIIHNHYHWGPSMVSHYAPHTLRKRSSDSSSSSSSPSRR